MSTIIDELNGLKITEMVNTSTLGGVDLIPVVQDGFNKKTTIAQVKEMLGVTNLTSDLQNSSTTTGASANATNQLLVRLTNLRNEIQALMLDVNAEIYRLDESINDIKDGDINVDWNNIENKPTDEELKGPKGDAGPQGLRGVAGEDGLPGQRGPAGIDGANGVDGRDGVDGHNAYFHVKYSINANGNPMTDTPSKYIGTAVTNFITPPTNYTVYTWYEWKGAQGPDGEQGIPGTNGSDGKTSYLHIKYGVGYGSDDRMIFTANNGEDPGPWVGMYTDQILMDNSNPDTYTWSYVKGPIGEQGEPGVPGPNGPISVYLGTYSSTSTYIGNSKTLNIVKWNNGINDFYYITKVTTGEITNVPPSNTLYWETFQGQYKNIATEFLFAEGANIGGWIFYKNASLEDELRSQETIVQESEFGNITVAKTILNGTKGTITSNGQYGKINISASSIKFYQQDKNVASMDYSTIPSSSKYCMIFLTSYNASGDRTGESKVTGDYIESNIYSTITHSSNTYSKLSYTKVEGNRVEMNHFIPGFPVTIPIITVDTFYQATTGAAPVLRINLVGLPTTLATAEVGCLWNDNGTLKIKL
mgnify:CR=1 FL=1